MSQHSTGVLIAELLEKFLDEVHDSLKNKRYGEATTRVDHLRTRLRGFSERSDRVLKLRELAIKVRTEHAQK